MNEVSYASAIGSLMYAMLCTRLDIAFAVSVVSKYHSNPRERRWTVVKAILKYLRMTKELILGYGGSELTLKGYSDSDFQLDVDDRKSTFVFIFVCNRDAVSWKNAKQSTTVDSTIEVEYIVASKITKEAIWMHIFVTELGIVPQMSQPVIIFYDNTGAIAQAKEPTAHQRSKHVQ
ncbi:secreted RxLR effector protein 161-like [Mangifera indica]|uniref:secreted RxLR effector protein 161-like n=1 Tax=Mangifera indica TaxID=29780 RepID=UPI001CFA6A14|nr:secreted RxLR effector protein 161-like [Mangifera indica]